MTGNAKRQIPKSSSRAKKASSKAVVTPRKASGAGKVSVKRGPSEFYVEITAPKPKSVEAAALVEIDHSASINPLRRLIQEVESTLRQGGTVRLLSEGLHALLGDVFTREEIHALAVPERTLARRLEKHQALNSEETDRTLRLARITVEAARVFGDDMKAGRWLRRENPALSQQTPLQLLETESGAKIVGDLLGQIDHGMFA
jgi:putative toxin-antitoxin system antitoxin component (TIGR02293 family)